ncbi:MAG: DUF3224 domain-containing protein [Actinomycetota bacterium]|nr:DUF3224 domain-containing protein [Actinomycetota bacterium]
MAKTYRGVVEGKSTGEFLIAYGAEEGSAAYVGFERITGRVHGRSGSFVLHHSASSAGSRGARSTTWSVVPNSGTSELRGLRGEARIFNEPDGGHSLTLVYELSEATSRAVLEGSSNTP